jgi:hypothetical protein
MELEWRGEIYYLQAENVILTPIDLDWRVGIYYLQAEIMNLTPIDLFAQMDGLYCLQNDTMMIAIVTFLLFLLVGESGILL